MSLRQFRTLGRSGDTGRLSVANPFGDSKFTDRNWEILAVRVCVAREIDRTPHRRHLPGRWPAAWCSAALTCGLGGPDRLTACAAMGCGGRSAVIPHSSP